MVKGDPMGGLDYVVAPVPPPGVAGHCQGYPGPERRNLAVREQLVRRIRNEFEEMPGLRLTFGQARLLFDLDAGCCERVLNALLSAGFLVRTKNDQFGRRDLVA